MKFKRKGLFKIIWRAWLFDPHWKRSRRVMWFCVIVNLISMSKFIYDHDWYLVPLYPFLIFVVAWSNYVGYVSHIENIFMQVLLNVRNENEEEVAD